MIYMIGGAPRVGKSTLARILLKRKRFPYIASDAIFHMLKEAAPQLGVTDEVSHEERAEVFFPYLKRLVHHIQICENDYVIEGDCFLPKQAAALGQDHEVKSCFLGVSSMELETILQNRGHNSWIDALSPEKLKELPNWIVDLSALFKGESQKYGVQYFDLSGDYSGVMEQAYEFLVKP
ncbi:hypothetical protein A3A70_03300 [candidate division WWE3 bacterium RIFCSPLOWO2_01_FULL_42_11]|uniref:Adenylate kinase n=1 Tax=candidate division WWE3 bacterium RIFCSPLOWO2_01_FULL_42_11 TaxID=1802627 RepID=A0A1F4VM93_UNCKA|nr:MAG: hypothetical protein A3A70_03300 [candidate division WWE3 bacterium RIFCSPLOWO2_01_FULL_42_11]